ncbi:MAG: toxin HipA [Deltaproteobacteria bacterium]|nr:toxin HipA [Deltaproteobacteria bacterium]
MKRARVFVHKTEAGILEEIVKGRSYRFCYHDAYQGPPVSLTMPVVERNFDYDRFPPFFDGLLPEGIQLLGLLRQGKLDKDDYMQQLITVGADLVGAVSVEGLDDE